MRRRNIELVEKGRREIENCRHEDFSNLNGTWIANKLGVGLANLSRAFKQDCDTSLQEHVTIAKVRRGFELLQENNTMTLQEIAETIGFCNSSYFIKKFKEYYGRTPGEFRESNLSSLPPPLRYGDMYSDEM